MFSVKVGNIPFDNGEQLARERFRPPNQDLATRGVSAAGPMNTISTLEGRNNGFSPERAERVK